MPQSRTRKGADAKRKAAQARKTAERQDANAEERATQAPTTAERRRAKRAEHEADTSASKKAAGSKSAGSKSAAATKGGSVRRTTAERRGVANKAVANKGGGARVRRGPASRRWVPPTFITAFLLGVAWLIVYYVAGDLIPLMGDLGSWNILVGMGLMALSFIIATLWK